MGFTETGTITGFTGSTNYELAKPGVGRRQRPFMSNTVGVIAVGEEVVPVCVECTGVSCVHSSDVEDVGPDPGRRVVRAGYLPTHIRGSGGSQSPWSWLTPRALGRPPVVEDEWVAVIARSGIFRGLALLISVRGRSVAVFFYACLVLQERFPFWVLFRRRYSSQCSMSYTGAAVLGVCNSNCL